MLPERERSHVTTTTLPSCSCAGPWTSRCPLVESPSLGSGLSSPFLPLAPPLSLFLLLPLSSVYSQCVKKIQIWNVVGRPRHGEILFSSRSATERDLTSAGVSWGGLSQARNACVPDRGRAWQAYCPKGSRHRAHSRTLYTSLMDQSISRQL